jgi:aldose 1-epimerase
MIRLTHGDDSLIVMQDHGAAILGWTHGGTHLLRHPSPEAVLLGNPGAMGCFPLVPYCNRIGHRRFNWAGQAYELAANFGDHPHAIHGVGWQRKWSVEEVSDASITLSLHHDANGAAALSWPFAFSALLTYRLTGDGLTIQIEVSNLHGSPAPMGVGAHPYFPRAPNQTIAFQAGGVWLNRDALPRTHASIAAAWDHTNGRAMDGEPLDNCFTGWNGEAMLPGPRIQADAIFGNLQVFTPAGADFFCVEPVSHVPDAINHPELPKSQAMTVLEPGQMLSGSIRLIRAAP